MQPPQKASDVGGQPFQRAPAQGACPILHVSVHIDRSEVGKLPSDQTLSQPIKKTPCFGTAIRNCYVGESAQADHPLCVLSANILLQSLGRRSRHRYRWPLALGQV